MEIKTTDIFDRQSRTPREQLKGFNNSGTAGDWMIEGAIREDDYARHPGLELLGCTPPENPPSQIDRPLHHFFDVQHQGRGLTVGTVSGFPAPDWALGRQGRGPNQDQNQFSILDARIYQQRSLTAPTRDERERNTALLFRTLGQVIHVLQDMAQPQHTRNDPHAGCLEFIGAGEHSWYEDYMETRALGIPFRTRGGPSPPLSLGGYPLPRFTAFQDFWTDGLRRGLADFSSRNFFSAGTDLSLFGNCGGFLEPPCRLNAYRQQDQSFSIPTVNGTTVTGTVRLFLHTMQDPVTGAIIPDVAVTSRSVWDQHLETRGLFPAFSLNTLNYDSISGVLLPRAVGYSAGLLDYFFRGRLQVVVAAHATDPNQRELRVTNRSAEALGPGRLTLYADNAEGRREPVEGAVLQVTEPVQPEAPLPVLPFTPPAGVTGYVVVLEGRLGLEEEAVVGSTERARLEAVFIGSKAGIGNGVFIATEDGTFLLRKQEPGEFLDRVAWGTNPNVILVQGRVLPESNKTSWELWRINRDLESSDMPILEGQAVADVEKIDATKFETHPTEPDLTIPGSHSASVTVKVKRELSAALIRNGLNFTVEGTSSFKLKEDEVVFNISNNKPINLDREKVGQANSSTPIYGYVDDRDHLIVLFGLFWSPTSVFGDDFQSVQFWGCQHPLFNQATFKTLIVAGPIPGTTQEVTGYFLTEAQAGSFLGTAPTTQILPDTFKARPGNFSITTGVFNIQLMDLVIVDMTERKVLAKSFSDVAWSWTRTLYGSTGGNFIDPPGVFAQAFAIGRVHPLQGPDEYLINHPPGTVLPAPGSEHISGYVTAIGAPFGDLTLSAAGFAAQKDIADIAVAGRGFFGLHVNPPVTQATNELTEDIIFNQPVLLTDRPKIHPEESQPEVPNQSFPWRPRVRNQGIVYVEVRNKLTPADDKYKVVRWQFPILPGEEERLETLFTQDTPAGLNFLNVMIEAHEAAAYATFRNPQDSALIAAKLKTDVEKNVLTVPGRIEFAWPDEQVNNASEDRRRYDIVSDDGTASFLTTSKPEKDILSAENLGGVSPFNSFFFEDGVSAPNVLFHLAGK